nr:MAG TPA: hypothetical protein [Caudoviricetes sp.]
MFINFQVKNQKKTVRKSGLLLFCSLQRFRILLMVNI